MIFRLIIIIGIQYLLFLGPALAKETLRNPFLSPFYVKPASVALFKKEVVIPKKVEKPRPKVEILKPPVVDVASLNLKLNGVVWGGNWPQAIINGQVVGVGESVIVSSSGNSLEKAKIILINQKGVQILYKGVKINLNVDKDQGEKT